MVPLDVLADWSIPFIYFGKTLTFNIRYSSFIISPHADQSPPVTVVISVFRLSLDVCAHICAYKCVYWE